MQLKDGASRLVHYVYVWHTSPELTGVVPAVGHVSTSLITITAAMAIWIATCKTTVYITYWFCHISFSFCAASTGITISAYLRFFLLTPCNVISFNCNNTNATAYFIGFKFTSLHLMYESPLCTTLHLHIFTYIYMCYIYIGLCIYIYIYIYIYWRHAQGKAYFHIIGLFNVHFLNIYILWVPNSLQKLLPLQFANISALHFEVGIELFSMASTLLYPWLQGWCNTTNHTIPGLHHLTRRLCD